MKTYLGDSVYAEVVNGYLRLTTENGYPDDPRNIIYLEPSVYGQMLLWMSRSTEARDAGFPTAE